MCVLTSFTPSFSVYDVAMRGHQSRDTRPRRGFQKILLTAGQTGHVSFTLDNRSFSHRDTASHTWKVSAGQHRILVGGSSRDQPLTTTVTLDAA